MPLLLFKKLIKIITAFITTISCLWVLSELTQCHIGLLWLMLQHSHPQEYVDLIKILITQCHMHTETIYHILKENILDIRSPKSIILLINDRLKKKNDFLSADELKHFIRHVLPNSRNTTVLNENSNHHSGITLTITQSTKRLLQRYSTVDLSEQYLHLMDYIKNLPDTKRAEITSLLNLVNDFEKNKTRHCITGLSLPDIIGLTWYALHDNSPDVWNDTTHSWHKKRPEEFINTLVFMSKHQQPDALDNSKSISLCFNGIYNFCLEAMDRFHIDVTLDDTYPVSILADRIIQLLKHYMSLEDPHHQDNLMQTMDPETDGPTDGYQWLEQMSAQIFSVVNNEFCSHIKASTIKSYCDPAFLMYINFEKDYAPGNKVNILP